MEYAIITAPAAPIRRKPDHRKEMVNQLLFGERVQILKTRGPLWIKIRSLHDDYEGWMTNSLLQPVSKKETQAAIPWVAADLLNTITVQDKTMHIPAGASLPYFAGQPDDTPKEAGKLGEWLFNYKGSCIKRDEQKPDVLLLEKLVMPWVNAPYLWGGRTPLGVDCSGFTQVIFKMMGIDLPRDAWQQAQEGEPVKKFSAALAGDLAFFNNKEDIVHVGILLGNDRIIHASGRVKIDNIDKKGVMDAATGNRILSLGAIRRIW